MGIHRETKQKKMIEDEVLHIRTFFTAEELHDIIKKKDTTIGIATVYRFLKELKERGGIHTYTCNRRTLYSKQQLNHSHFICERCGNSEHIALNNINFLKGITSGDICHFQIEVTGICNHCKKSMR